MTEGVNDVTITKSYVTYRHSWRHNFVIMAAKFKQQAKK
jgi:hypothetical protein